MTQSFGPVTAETIPTAYQTALRLQSTGKLNEALSLYQQISRVNPRIAEVHFQVARIFASAGKFEKALPHVRTSAQIKPKEAAVWALWAEVLIGLNDKKELERFDRALRRSALPGPAKAKIRKLLHPQSKTAAKDHVPETMLEDIADLIESGQLDEAETRLKKLLGNAPNLPALLRLQAKLHLERDKPDMALKTLQKALSSAPDAADVHLDLGRVLLATGHPIEAVESLRRATRFAPEMAMAWSELGRALTQLDQTDEAMQVLEKACNLAPDLGQAHFNRAMLLVKLERDDAAIDAFQKAIDNGCATAQAFAMLARAQGVLRREDEALENFDKALQLDPNYAFAYARRAALLQTRGDFDAAEADFRKAIELDPDNGETYRVFSASHKFRPDDPLLAQMQKRWNDADLGDRDRMNLGFALAKALEDSKQYEKVFTYLKPANDLMRKAFPYDVNSRALEIEKVKAAFDDFDFETPFSGGDDSFAPIFVTGMPRSGTTLVEQILASHSTVTGAGEVGEFSREAYKLIATPEGPFHKVSGLNHEQMTALGKHYSQFMRSRFPDADRITDKSIQTYLVMGFVKLALPRARVVVVRRDPRDNLLSIYKNVFHDGAHRYAYDLRDLGIYYKLFEEMIDYWRKRLPGYFHEISYDALTADPEAESRKLLAACDLEWQDQCLNFHQNKNRVDTLSIYQVRQPIYRSSVKAWQRYETELQALFDALK